MGGRPRHVYIYIYIYMKSYQMHYLGDMGCVDLLYQQCSGALSQLSIACKYL